MRALLVVALVATASTAHANCPDKRASCVLHEEGVALFLEGKNDQAASKFAAAIAAEPTARSYLGYAQAVEALGQIALAYDTMVAAQRLSQAELQATGGKDVEVSSRAERIKYKLGELRAKIGFVWLRVPDGVAPQRVVAVQRQGEGDLSQPLTQWTAVAPGKQVLVASIDDGTKLQVVAQVAAGTQGVVVIPVPQRGGPQQNITPIPTGRPLTSLYVPVPKPAPPPIESYFSVAASLAAPGPQPSQSLVGTAPDRASQGNGLTAFYERRFGQTALGLATRLDFLFHSATHGDSFMPAPDEVSGSEVVAMAGVRTMGSRSLQARALLGFTIYSQKTTDPSGLEVENFTRLYPAVELGGGLHLGRLRLMMGLMFTAPGDATVQLGTRFMASAGIDLWRK